MCIDILLHAIFYDWVGISVISFHILNHQQVKNFNIKQNFSKLDILPIPTCKFFHRTLSVFIGKHDRVPSYRGKHGHGILRMQSKVYILGVSPGNGMEIRKDLSNRK